MENIAVCLMDNTFKGHHLVYLNALKKINFVRDISKEFETTVSIKKIIPYIRDRKNILDFAIRHKQQEEILHLLYLDNLYTVGAFLHIPKSLKIIGTLHHYPNNKSKERLLKMFSKKLLYIIVHSEYIAKQLESIQIRNYVTIDYPVFHSSTKKLDQELLREQAGISKNKVVISALGGTRFDKGLDIFLDSLKYVEDVNKEKLLINIAGKEETYKKDYIFKKIEESGLNVRLNLRHLTDEEFEQNVQISDAIILPYRNVFTGNSGPMTEGVYREKPIIGTDNGNLGYLIKNFHLGFTFESENPKSLGKSISKFVSEGWNSSGKSRVYRDRLNIERFLQEHVKLYQFIKAEKG